MAQVAFGVEGVDVFFGIARHADREFRVVALLDLAVDEFSAVHVGDLPHEVHGVGVALRMGHETLFVLRLVSAQRQHVVQAQEVHVDQRVLDVVFRQSAADQVRDHLHAVAVLDGRRDAHRPGAAAHDVPFDAAVLALGLLDSLAVEGDVDVSRVEGHQRLHGGEYLLHAVALERREQFEREAGAPGGDRFVDDLYDVHTLFGIIFFTVSASIPRRRA